MKQRSSIVSRQALSKNPTPPSSYHTKPHARPRKNKKGSMKRRKPIKKHKLDKLTNNEKWYRKGWLDAQETVAISKSEGDDNEMVVFCAKQSCEYPKDCGNCMPCLAREMKRNAEAKI